MSKLTSTTAVALALALSAGPASADTSGKKIALSRPCRS